jgi:glycosyltransferase involved in cell wall biosynthesis
MSLFLPKTMSSRFTRFIPRNARRFRAFFTFFFEHLEKHGAKHAVFVSTKKLIKRLTAAAAFLPAPLEHRRGVLFIGYAEGALGLGEAFRANLAAAATTAIPFAIYPFRTGIETRLSAPYIPERYDELHAYELNILQVAADTLPLVFWSRHPSFFENSYNILITYWELGAAPDEWRNNLAQINEIWAPNNFVARAFAHIFDGPILIMPPAMAKSSEAHPGRMYYGMDEDRFYFMFSFDYYSSPFRKNPLGVIRAFQEAFPSGQENVGLIIKSTDAPELNPDIRASIRYSVSHDQRILVIDKNLSREDMLGLIQASDAYVSLHRSEGFGLGMAEALSFGRIVIGTNYSGCTAFLNEETGYPVPYHLRPVLPHEYPYSAGQVWAEPDLTAAVKIMREIVANPAEARLRATRGQMLITERYDTYKVGAMMRDRLYELLDRRRIWSQ